MGIGMTVAKLSSHSVQDLVYIILAYSSRVAFRTNVISLKQQQFGPVVKMAVSPCGTKIAFFTNTGKVLVKTKDMKGTVVEFDTEIEEPPRQLLW